MTVPLILKNTTEIVATGAAERLRIALEALIEENHQLRAVIAAMQAPKPVFANPGAKQAGDCSS